MSKSTYYRLKEKSKNKGTTFWKNYKKNSIKPHMVRQSKIDLQTRSIILDIRNKYKTYGKAKIKAIINKTYPNIGKEILESSIGRILKNLNKES